MLLLFLLLLLFRGENWRTQEKNPLRAEYRTSEVNPHISSSPESNPCHTGERRMLRPQPETPPIILRRARSCRCGLPSLLNISFVRCRRFILKVFFFQTSPEWQQVHDSCWQKMDITVFKLPSITWLPWWSRCRAWSCMESHSWLLDIWSWHQIVTQWPGCNERAVKHQQWHGTYCQRVHWLTNYTALSIEGILAYHSIGIHRFSVGWLFSLSFGRKPVLVV